MSIQALREARNAAARDLRNHYDKHKDSWNADHQKVYDELAAKIDGFDGQIAAEERLLSIEASNNERLNRIEERDDVGRTEAGNRAEQESAIMRAWLVGGPQALTNQQRQYLDNRRNEAIRNGTLSTSPNVDGGYLVQQEFARSILEAMKLFGGMRQVATIMATANGASFLQPTTDSSSEEGEIVAENAAATTDTSIAFGSKLIGAYRFSSKLVPISLELLQDSAVDIEGHVRDRLTKRLARITERLFTTGTGVGQPEGIITAAAVGKALAAGGATSFTYDDLVDLEHSVDPAYRARAKYMFNDAVLKVLKRMKDGQNRPLWLPSIAGVAPSTISGYEYQLNQAMAAPAANAKSVAFGDLSTYTIRDVLAVDIYRFADSAFMSKGQIALLGFSRHDGKLMDVGGAVKTLQHSAT
ncbi:phage major capsid protein [Pseudogulbenkiania ferrooxidans]|uniref:Phage major capsid protein, HK97 family n=1 Tax=Pseudogulbenkiania ferrooxidans 2002 TaxID=279714 RepID=B9YYU1_9NEIS|nr:phage major capsid protein [Pseudogulbenkiania ferrooxidans]EEG10294.1 phage major capsid protein, HK97 family [Pseudogulbenkiania ferrooxidans 2002]